MTPAHLVFVALFALTLVARDVYELLKKTQRIDPTDKRVFVAVFTSMCVMWVSWFGIGLVAPERLTLPAPLQWAGLAAVAVGVVLAVGGMWTLKGVENIDHLVTTGLFSKFRHPMYVGFALWIVGWVLYGGAPSSLLFAPVGLVSIVWWRALEERDLEARYGQTYVAYRATTWV